MNFLHFTFECGTFSIYAYQAKSIIYFTFWLIYLREFIFWLSLDICCGRHYCDSSCFSMFVTTLDTL